MKLRLKKPRLTVESASLALLGIGGVGLLLFRLGSLLPGFAPVEMRLPGIKQVIEQLWNEPLLVPYSLSQLFVTILAPGAGFTASRLPAVLIGGLTAVLLFWVLKQWYGYRLAVFGTALTITAPWFLHVSRLATPAVVYPFTMTLILVLAVLWHRKERSSWLLYLSAVVTALTISVPGGIWLLACVVLIERRNILASYKATKWHALAASLVSLVLLIPLIHTLISTSNRTWSLVPFGYSGQWQSLIDYLQQFGAVWLHIFIGGYKDPLYNLAGLPVISSLLTVACAIGIYLYAKHRKAARTKLLALLWLVGTAVIALPNNVNLTLILPILMVLVTGGIGYLLHLWLKVFPRNPIARGFGIALIGLVIAFGVAYNLRNYFVAWPHNRATTAYFWRQL